MNLLTAESLSKSYNESFLFNDLSISLAAGEKMALIAANGSGKTTLMRIITGQESPDSGQVTIRNGITLGYLEQNPYFNPEATVLECIFSSNHPVLHALGEYEKMLDEGENADTKKLQQLADKIDSLGAWDYEHKAHEILGKLGIHDFDKQVKSLSGGQKKRVSLAKLLIGEPDILLLDEPTNHLDLEMIEWLENYLVRLNKTVLLVTHDRYFLDQVCNSISELENGKLYKYTGNYAYFLEKKSEREEQQSSEYNKARNVYRRELDWMRRQPKARGTKQKARQDSFYETEETVKSKRIEDRLTLSMQMQRMGHKILELENVCKSYGEKVLIRDFNHVFRRGEKIGIVGKNGVGKSTLLNMIMGIVKPDKGKIRTGETIQFGYFTQEEFFVKEDKRVIDFAKDIAEYVEVGKGKGKWIGISQFLNFFLFPPSKQQTLISKLSGGEKKRLQMLAIIIRNPNFLILDEPTNDLDITTLNVLEEFLVNYEGCILMVTHDRYFMDKLADHVFAFDGTGNIREVHGNYTDYRQLEAEEVKEKSGARRETERLKEQDVRLAREKNSKGLSFKEKRELEQLEKELEELENKKKALLDKMNAGSLGHTEMHDTSIAYNETVNIIDEKTVRWMELSDK